MTYNGESDAAPTSAEPNNEDKAHMFSAAVEKAKAIAARLAAAGKAQSEIPDDPVSLSNKRTHSEVDDYKPPSSGYRREDFQSESKRPATESDRYGGGDDNQQYGGMGGSRPRFGLGHSDSPAGSSMSHYGPGAGGGRVSEEMSVPNEYVGLIIGRSGENMKKIERTCNVKVQFAPAVGNEQDRRTTITGAPQDVAEAKGMIQEQINQGLGPGPRTQAPMQYQAPAGQSENMSIPAHKVGLVIGRGGETIHSLQDRSGARITVTPEGPGEQGSQMRTIQISGGLNAIDMARHLIDELVNAPGPRGGPGGYGMQAQGEVIKVHTERVGLVIGRGGEVVKNIQSQCDVRIKIDQNADGEGNRTVTITGPPENIERAKEMVMDRVQGRRENGPPFGGGGGYQQQGGYGGYGGGGGGGFGGNQGYGQGGGGYGGDYSQQQGYEQAPGSAYPGWDQQQQQQQGADGQGYDHEAWAAYYAQCQAYYQQYPEMAQQAYPGAEGAAAPGTGAEEHHYQQAAVASSAPPAESDSSNAAPPADAQPSADQAQPPPPPPSGDQDEAAK
ncbi:hypothetical protein PhCBS80983_g06086 [Powellomyces hirtus]|uniref:K Homology domain-containing protein n=1 Tax=Powellomyces hirtus TaxID=109895 RepID=A0A507DRY4_9FUNG|nr:hypothetical protein PhCBS80983_g06086 [Powellomyces hirtus]